MISETDVTFIIPIFRLDEDRLKNLKFVLPYIMKTGKKVILAEQTDIDDRAHPELYDLVAHEFKDNFKYLIYKHDSNKIHKTGIVNWATKVFVKTKYAWVTDADFYMNFDAVLNQEWTEKFIKPYSIAKRLTKEDSEKVLSGELTEIDFADVSAEYTSMFSALSFIYERDVFLEIGGMNDKFMGWGKEDVYLNQRIRQNNITVKEFQCNGVHLWHQKFEIKEYEDPKKIQRMDMAILVCHFNWCNYFTPTENLRKFVLDMRSYEIPLYGVELSLNDDFETTNLKNWKQIKVDPSNVCFQKEACINMLEKEVPAEYTKIAWIDADLKFVNPNWYIDTSNALDTYKVVQMYSTYHHTNSNGDVVNRQNSMMYLGGPLNELKDNGAEQGRMSLNGLPGGALAANRDLWKHGGLYPYCFVGGGDTAFLFSLFGKEKHPWIKSMIGLYGQNENCNKFENWKQQVVSYVGNSVGFVNGDIVHSWHGELVDRKYESRAELYSLLNIDNDLSLDEHELLKINLNDDIIRQKIFDYFKGRREDGDKIKKNEIVVYTVILGNYDILKELSNKEEGIDYICFTDAPLESKTWQIREIPKSIELLPYKKIPRCLKTLPHLFLPEYQTSLWVDASIEILKDTHKFIKNNLKNSLAIARHPDRNCIYDEAVEILNRGKDRPIEIIPQVMEYSKANYPVKHGLVQTGIIIRKHNVAECKKFCEQWWNHISRHSHRDQMSFNYTLWENPMKVDIFDPIVFTSEYFYLYTHNHKGTERVKSIETEECIKNFINGEPI